MLSVGTAWCSALKSLGFRLETMRSHCQVVKGVGHSECKESGVEVGMGVELESGGQ